MKKTKKIDEMDRFDDFYFRYRKINRRIMIIIAIILSVMLMLSAFSAISDQTWHNISMPTIYIELGLIFLDLIMTGIYHFRRYNKQR